MFHNGTHRALRGLHPSFEGTDAVTEPAIVGFDMRKTILSYMNDESGAAAAEYALILAIVASGIAAAALGLGQAISTAMSNAALWVAITP